MLSFTAWQIASVPLWGSGFYVAYIALLIGCGKAKQPGETRGQITAQMCFGMLFSTVFLIIAAWMSHIGGAC